MQRVIGGDIYFIDTEARRGLHYADRFQFRHIDFQPPFGPLDYLAAIEHCVAKGAKILVIDSLTHEHNGVGGVMDQIDAYLDRKCGDNEREREKYFMLANKQPKADRKRLNTRIVQLGINAIFCYRANDAVKPIKGQGIQHIGWTPETTSKLIYEMAQCFLLGPGSDGRPTLQPETNAERLLTKNPEQFRDWFKDGVQLSEDIGERMARWAQGGKPADVPKAEPPSDLLLDHAALLDIGQSKAQESADALKAWWEGLQPKQRVVLKGDIQHLKEAAIRG